MPQLQSTKTLTKTLNGSLENAVNETLNESEVLIKAFNNACTALKVSRDQASQILGVDKATLTRNKTKGFDPRSKTGELCLHFVRVYRSLFAIAGGDANFMRHWLSTDNKVLAGQPLELLSSVVGLVRVNQYLDAMRGKV